MKISSIKKPFLLCITAFILIFPMQLSAQSQAADKERCYHVATDGKAWCSGNNCKLVCDGAPPNDSSSSSSYTNSAARTEAIATGVETLINIFTADSERKQQQRREWDEQARKFNEGQANAKSMFDSMAPAPRSSSVASSGSRTSSSNPWGDGNEDIEIKSSKETDLSRAGCLQVIKNPSASNYIGLLSVQNVCSEPISYSFCYLSGGSDSWGDWECKQNAQGYFGRGGDVVAAGDTQVLPSSLANTNVALAACAKSGLPFITTINQRQSSFICK